MTNQSLVFVLEVLSLVTVLVLFGILGALVRRRREPSAIPFTAFLVTLTLWAAVELALPVAGVSLTRSVSGIEVGTVLQTAALLTLPLCWFWYTITYSGRGDRLTLARGALLAAPVVASVPVAYALTAVRGSIPDVAGALAVLFVLVQAAYAVGLLSLGGYLLGRLAVTYNQVSLGQVLALGTATALPYLASLMSAVTQPRNGETVSLLPVDVTPLGFFAAAVLLAVAVGRYPVLSVLPEAASIARDEVVEELAEGVIVLDRAGRILDVNAAAARILDRSPTAALGEPVSAVLAVDVSTLDTAQSVELETAAGVRQFEINVSPLGDGDEPIGQTLVLRDVTERQTREQRLEVLNRVLRHNLRNNVDVILAHAETIDARETREAIRGSARHLVGEAQKARDTEQMLDDSGSQPSEVAVTELIHSVADRLADEYEGSEITVDGPADLTVRTRYTVVERIVTELIENGIEHNDQPTPRVDVEVCRDDSARPATISIRVADNGPGIPAHERRIAREETESQHSHGSGVGLWLVNWGVSHLGGTLSFADRDPGGSVVTVTLPDL